MKYALATATLATAVAGCDLKDVIVPEGDPVVIVHAVIRPDLPTEFEGRQFVVVERSLTGLVNPDTASKSSDGRFHRADSLTIPYGGYPSVPVEGAAVYVSNLDLQDDPCGSQVQFLEDPAGPTKQSAKGPGIYWSPQGCPTMRVGDRLALTVETTEGEVVTGQTLVPGMDGAYMLVSNDSISFGTDQTTSFNRDRDTLEIGIEPVAGRLLQFEVRRFGDLTDFGTKIYIDTTSFRLPAHVVNTFVIGDEDDVFRAGRNYVVSVALTDQNYFDFSRSRNNTFTGRGFINRLSGGIGLFGSLVALSTTAQAVGDIDDPREGVYSLQGSYLDSVDVGIEMELYLALDADSTDFSAFAEGDWLFGEYNRSIDGYFAGNEFTGVLIDTVGTTARADTLRGVRQDAGAWQVILFERCGSGPNSNPCDQERKILFRGTMEQR